MPFLSVTPFNFRNLRNETADLSSREIFLVGTNGQGKSNVLESLYYSAYASSFRTHNEPELIKNGETEMGVRTIFRGENESTHTTSITVREKSKKIERDGIFIKDRKELVNDMPCVLYGHEDMEFVTGSPERRRFFIDQSLTMYDVFYIDVMRRYKRILKNRNLCLKEKHYELLDSYDFQLAKEGLEIQKKRKDGIFGFNQIFGRMYEKISGIDGVKIRYVPSWRENGKFPLHEEIVEFLAKNRAQDETMGTTLSGPHRDRIIFERGGIQFVPTSSTGQRRLLALVLRTSQSVFYSQTVGRKPVLLMDDVLLELDVEKRVKFNSLLPEYDQLFCTFLPGEPYENYRRQTTRIYSVKNGALEESK
jgi:DNA replication and repair protein RecF